MIVEGAVVMPMSCLTFQQIQVLKLFDIAMEMSREPYGNWLRIGSRWADRGDKEWPSGFLLELIAFAGNRKSFLLGNFYVRL